jgi:hypothetical protein
MIRVVFAAVSILNVLKESKIRAVTFRVSSARVVHSFFRARISTHFDDIDYYRIYAREGCEPSD